MHSLLIPRGGTEFSQAQVTSANVHKDTIWYWGGLMPIDNFLGYYIKGMKKKLLTDPVTFLFSLNFSTRRRATGGQLATLERSFDVWF